MELGSKRHQRDPFVTIPADWKDEYRIPDWWEKVYRPEGDLRGETGVSRWHGASGDAPYVIPKTMIFEET